MNKAYAPIFILFIMLSSDAFIINDFNTKTENNIIVSTHEIASIIFKNESKTFQTAYYYIEIPTALKDRLYAIDKSKISGTTTYSISIDSISAIKDKEIEECSTIEKAETDKTGDEGELTTSYETTCANTTKKEIELGKGDDKKFIIGITTEWEGKKKSWNITDTLIKFDPDISGCGNLTTAGETYTLTGDININGSTCFNVQAQNITLDCQGHTITGNNSSSTYGVYSNQYNTTVKNCKIYDFWTNIHMIGTDRATLLNNTLFNNVSTGYGISIVSSNNSIITNNNVSTGSAPYATVTISDFATGIFCRNQTIENNTLTTYGNGYGAFYIANPNITLRNNTIYLYSGYGVYALSDEKSYNLTIDGMSFYQMTASSSGVYPFRANSTVKNSYFNTSTAIRFTSYNISIINNTLDNANYMGVYANNDNADYMYIADNNITAPSGTAIYFGSADFAIVERNNVVSSISTGTLYLTTSAENNTIRYNNITAPSRPILISSSSNNNIYSNLINATSNYAVRIDSSGVSENNTIEKNNITTPSHGITFNTNSNNNLARHNRLNITGTGYAFYVLSSNNTAYNNTINAISSSGAIFVTSSGTGNLFYQNNITAPVWVYDNGASNHYNTTGMGNIYYFPNGTASWEVFNISSLPGSNWAITGTNRPFNATTVGGNFTGSGNPQDWHPFTNKPLSIYILASILPPIGGSYSKTGIPYLIEGSTYGCNITIKTSIIGETISGSTNTQACKLYYQNTTLKETKTGSWNDTAIFQINASNNYIINCTATTSWEGGAMENSTDTEVVQFVGASFCPGGEIETYGGINVGFILLVLVFVLLIIFNTPSIIQSLFLIIFSVVSFASSEQGSLLYNISLFLILISSVWFFYLILSFVYSKMTSRLKDFNRRRHGY